MNKSSVRPHAGNFPFVQNHTDYREVFPTACCIDSLHWEFLLPPVPQCSCCIMSTIRSLPLTDQTVSPSQRPGSTVHTRGLTCSGCPGSECHAQTSKQKKPAQDHQLLKYKDLWGCQYKQLNQKCWYETTTNIYIHCSTRNNFLERRFEVLKYSKRKVAKSPYFGMFVWTWKF